MKKNALLVAVVVLSPWLQPLRAQWSQNSGVGPYTYTAPANWVGGNINGWFSIAPANGLVVQFTNDFTLTNSLLFGYGTTANVTLQSSSSTARTLKLLGDILLTNSQATTITVGTTANPLTLDLNGAARNIGGGYPRGSLTGTMNVYARITDSSGRTNALSVNQSGLVYTSLLNTNNNFIGPVTFASARGGGFASIRNIGEGPSSLGAPTDIATGTITVADGTSTGALSYYGSGDTSDRPFVWNLNFVGPYIANSFQFQNIGTGLLRLTGPWTMPTTLGAELLINASNAPIQLDGCLKNPSGGNAYIRFTGTSSTITLNNPTNDFAAFDIYGGVALAYNTVSNAGAPCSLGTNGTIFLKDGTLRYVGTNALATNSRVILCAGPATNWNVDNGSVNTLCLERLACTNVTSSCTNLYLGSGGPAGLRVINLNVLATNDAGIGSAGILLAKTWLADATPTNSVQIVAGSVAGSSGFSAGTVRLLNPTNTFSGGVQIKHGRTLEIMTLADSNTACSIGLGTNPLSKYAAVTFGSTDSQRGGTLAYIGTNDVSCNRQLAVLCTNGGTNLVAVLNNSPSNSALRLSSTGSVALNSTTMSNCAVVLGGSATGATNTLDATLGDPPQGKTRLEVKGSTWVLTGTHTYTGGTQVNGGCLAVNGSVRGGVTNNSGLLGGTGTIKGSVNMAGGLLAPGWGGAPIGTLTITNGLTLAGSASTVFILNRTNSQPASKVIASAVTYGGTLSVSNAGPALQEGDTFTLIAASSYAGAFTALNLPALDQGLSWNTSLLPWTGQVQVTGTNQGGYWTTGYYPGYRQFSVPPSNIDFAPLTHVIHFAVIPNTDGTLDSTTRSLSTNHCADMVSRAHAAGRPVLICVGGSGSQSGFQGATTTNYLATFISNITNFMASRGYDGVDLDWEPLPSTDCPQYSNMVVALKTALNGFSPPKLLTAAINSYASSSDPAPTACYTMLAALQNDFDQINLMTYDMAGPWYNWITWFNSPLYDGGTRLSNGKLMPSVEGGVNNTVTNGVAIDKLGLGVPFYGDIWTGGPGVTGPRQGWPQANPPTMTAVMYCTIVTDYYQSNRYFWDTNAQAAYLSITNAVATNNMFISFDDARGCQTKVAYARARGMGGVII